MRFKETLQNDKIEEKSEWRYFDWKRPNNLIQADITLFNGVHILTMEDDHSRKAWAKDLDNAQTETVINGMKGHIGNLV